MICPNCGVNDQHRTISTRRRSDEYILRRHECCVCGHKFNSVEITELTEKNLKVIEREMIKNCEPRQFEKMIHSIYRQIFDRYNWLKEKKNGSGAA